VDDALKDVTHVRILFPLEGGRIDAEKNGKVNRYGHNGVSDRQQDDAELAAKKGFTGDILDLPLR